MIVTLMEDYVDADDWGWMVAMIMVIDDEAEDD